MNFLRNPLVRKYSLFLLAAIPSPAFAQTLWQDIYIGMPATELRDRYPAQKGRVEFHEGWTELKGFVHVGSCKPDVSVMHPAGAVTRVKIEKIAMAGIFTKTCEDELYASLLAKYGSPASETAEGKDFLEASYWKNSKTIWIVNDITIKLERGIDMHHSWKLVYDAVAPAAQGL